MISVPAALLGKGNNLSGSIPFSITGTAANPIFRPDLGSEAGNLAKGLSGLGNSNGNNAAGLAKGILGGFLSKKKN